MTTESDTWANGPIHKALVAAFPLYVKQPFSESPQLDVGAFHEAIELSHETVYKWLRGQRNLNPRNIEKLVSVANRADNVAILAKMGRTPPTNEDFTPFLFA